MLKDIAIGQYYNANSFLHRLDPRTKIISLIVFMVLVFVAKGAVEYSFLTLVTIGLILISRVPFSFILKGLKPVWLLVVFTMAINLFLGGGEEVIFEKYFVTITREALELSISMMVRVVLLVVLSSILTLTTTAMDLTKGIERLLSPLGKIGFPANEVSMMMSIALRFIPTLANETEKIMKAQASRGNDFHTGSIFKKAKAMLPLFVPLFISAFRRADDLAVAMECRCYHTGSRTSFKMIKHTKKDLWAYIFVLMVAGVLVIYRIVGVLI